MRANEIPQPTGLHPPKSVVKQDRTDRKDAALKKACGEFEALFFSQVLRSMRKTVQESDLFGSRERETLFREMLDDEIAREICCSNDFGLAKLLYSELSRRVGTKHSQKSDSG
jgi:flagellar protein FlgJ